MATSERDNAGPRRDLIDALIRGDSTLEFHAEIGDPWMAPGAGDVRRWTDILAAGDRSPDWWRTVAASVRNADAITTDSGPDEGANRRGGYAWCQRAADTHRWLGPMDESHHTPSPTDHCRADPDVITVWLTTPGMYDHDPAITVAEVLEVAGQFDGSDVIAYPALQDLLIEAQDAGVWGVPGHRVDVHYVIDRYEQFDGFLLVTRPQANAGRGLASGLLNEYDVAGTHLTGVEAATAVLTNAAKVVNASIAGRVPATAPAPQTVTVQAGADLQALADDLAARAAAVRARQADAAPTTVATTAPPPRVRPFLPLDLTTTPTANPGHNTPTPPPAPDAARHR